MLCPACSQGQPLAYPVPVNALKVVRLLQNSDFNTAGRLKMTPELSHQLAGVMRGYLRYLLEREVKSATWLDKLREGTDAEVTGR